jgi:perosamine synthetase
VGFKYKMSNIQAAIGCGQMERIEALVTRKREILEAYKIRLSGIDGVAMNPEPDGTINGAWMPTAVFDRQTGITPEMLRSAFEAADIDARVFFHPLSSLPMFESKPQNEVAWSIPERAINLPSYHDMTEGDIDRVADTLLSVLQAPGELPGSRLLRTG